VPCDRIGVRTYFALPKYEGDPTPFTRQIARLRPMKFGFAFYFLEGFKSNLQVRNAGVLRTFFVRLCCPRWAKNQNLFRLNGHEPPAFQSKNMAWPSL
jgi:hypothetical protein